jgi:EmrB/QacA subfamily drug resistance transporter
MSQNHQEIKKTSRYMLFAALGVVLLLTSISGTAVSVAFPQIQQDLDTSLILAGWVLSMTQLVNTAIQPLAGKASDIFGRKRIFITCLVFFMVGCLFSALAPSIGWLIFSRFIQGIGAGGIFPSLMGIISDTFPEKRQQMIGFVSSIFPIGQIIGPNLGGWLTESFGWRYIFWFNIPFCIVAIIGIAVFLKSSPKTVKSQLDLIGAGLFSGALTAFMVGLSSLGDNQDSGYLYYSAVLFAASIILAILFFRRERRTKNPLFELEILKQKPFMAANIYNFLYGVCVLGITSLVALYAVTIYGMSTLESGLIITPRSIGMVITSTLASFYMVRWGYRWPILIGTVGIGIALFFLGLEPSESTFLGLNLTSTTILVLIMAFLGLGAGLATPASNNACIELMPERVGTIAGLRGMFRMSGGAIGINSATLILHSVGDMASGFKMIFIGFAIITIATIPLVFLMPSGTHKPIAVVSEE